MKRTFAEKSDETSIDAIAEALGSCNVYYDRLMKFTEEFQTKWTYYKGWSLKVFDRKKALFYFSPHYDGFMVSMAIRENERNSLLENDKFDFMHATLENTEKILEGYPVYLEVTDEKSYDVCELVVGEIMKHR